MSRLNSERDGERHGIGLCAVCDIEPERVYHAGGCRTLFLLSAQRPGLQRPAQRHQRLSVRHDGYGRLSSASLNGSGLANYAWNGLDQRAEKTALATQAVTDYVYDRAGHMIAEANDATGAMIREYIWMDDMPVAMVDDTGATPVVYDIHTDHLGRPQKLTDKSGNVLWDGVFDPFSNPSGISGSVTMLLGFPGQHWDSETQIAEKLAPEL